MNVYTDSTANVADPIGDMSLIEVEQDLKKAESYMNSGLVFEAAEIFSRHLESPESARAYHGMARCAFYRQDFHEALGYLQVLEKLDSQHPEINNTYGAVLFGLGLIDESRERFFKCTQAEPDNPLPWVNIADLDFRRERFSDCVDACRKALDLDPWNMEVVDLLSKAEEKMKEGDSSAQPGAEAQEKAIEASAVNAESQPVNQTSTNIEGVEIISMTPEMDERGFCFDIIAAMSKTRVPLGRFDISGAVRAGTIRAFTKQNTNWVGFFVSHGSAKIVLCDDRSESPTRGNSQTIIVGERNPSLVICPANIYFGWMALSDEMQLISFGANANGGKTTLPADAFGNVWA